MNTPYVKQFNADGTVKNPIIGMYVNHFPNRATRRKKEPRFVGCGKNYPLTIIQGWKYLRTRQTILCKDGTIKTILHYIKK